VPKYRRGCLPAVRQLYMIETTDKPDLTIAEIAARHKLSRQTVTKAV